MLITKFIEIEMGHKVTHHKGSCRFLHGHHYKIEVGVDDKVIIKKGSSDEGFVIDFKDLKDIMVEEIDIKFDHGFCLYIHDPYTKIFKQYFTQNKTIFVDFIPTAENLAKHWYNLIKPKLKRRNIKIKFVKVWETPTSTARYERT